MAYEIQRIDNKPIWVATLAEPYDSAKDAQGLDKAMADEIAGVEGKIIYIADMRKLHIRFGDIVTGLAEAFKSDSIVFFTNPRVVSLTVATDELIKMAAEAVKQDQYGGIDIKTFATVEEAIAYGEKVLAGDSA